MSELTKIFTAVFFILVLAILGFSMVSATLDTNAAKDYNNSVIDEIEVTNFNDNVIAACISQAQADGYTLTVNKVVTDADENKQVAEVVLNYKFSIPMLNISNTHSTRGFAR